MKKIQTVIEEGKLLMAVSEVKGQVPLGVAQKDLVTVCDFFVDCLIEYMEQDIDEKMEQLISYPFNIQEAYRNGMCLQLDIVKQAKAVVLNFKDL